MKKSRKNKIVVSLLILLFLLNIGYAAIEVSVNVTGTASSIKRDELFISEFYSTDSNDVVEKSLPEINTLNATVSTNFPSSDVAFITYTVTISNGTDSVQKYTGETFTATDTTKNVIGYEISSDLEVGDYLLPGKSVTFQLTYRYNNTAVAGDYDMNMAFNFSSSGDVAAELYTHEVDLTNIERAPIKIKIANSSDETISYQILNDNTKFELTDASGTPLTTLSIGPNTSENIEVYISKKSDITYYKTAYELNVSLKYDTTNFNFDKVKITTNVSDGYDEDNLPPAIGPVSIDINNTNGTFDVTWTNLDSSRSAPAVDYVVLLYDSSNNLIETAHTNSSATTYRFTSKSEGNYYAIVYGIDEAENSGESYVSSATTETTYSRKSATTNMKWLFTITYNLTKATKSGPDTAYRGEKVTVTFSPTGNNTITSYSVTDSSGNNLSSSEYTMNESSKTLTINSIDKDIIVNVTASSSCLIKGTKVLLRNGQYKNVEDITYEDLLLVYNHENGNFVGEYPIWIEKSKKTSSYQVTTFSDGTTLKTTGSHTVFSKDYNRYVNIEDRDKINIGSSILKVEKVDNKYQFKTVQVTKIETKYETIDYYDVVSTRYYNIIADDVLTSDGREGLVNFYEFNDDATWSNRRQEVIKNNTFLDYNKDMSFVPYYLYHGLRAQDGAVIIKYNYMTRAEFMSVFTELLLNPYMILSPNTDSSGNRIWMVTTSDDNVLSNDNYLYKEGSIYQLKEPSNKNNFLGWYNTGDGNMYQPGDKVVVYHGTHFEAIYKE